MVSLLRPVSESVLAAGRFGIDSGGGTSNPVVVQKRINRGVLA